MVTETRTIDAMGRLVLPTSFANATVVVEQVSETELRIRRTQVVPEDELPFREELTYPLSDRDRDLFLELLDHPPAPVPALIEAAARHQTRRA